ncbi:MAG: sodium/solute symporter [Henriciella sp.]|nr:sodium/solute symporter [Henriciella sp.]
MNMLDYSVVAAYLAGLIAFGYLLRKQESEKDYFLGGQEMNWFPLTLSTMATQLSAISFISAPAFVGLREGGGLKWLTYELSLPLAMLFVMFVIAPALYRAKVVSIYEFLQTRFGFSTRILISLSFQIVRSFGTGILIYAPALLLNAVIDIPMWQSIAVVGVITLVYSASGGMKAVVYGDAIQMVLIFIGLLVVGAYAVAEIGGIWSAIAAIDTERLTVIDVNSLGFSGDEFGLIPMLFGGFVLYASYYGCDQTQAQRLLSSKDIKSARRLLFANGLMRFPLVLIYCLTGLVVGAAILASPEMMAKIPADRPDYMMPVYIVETLPNGIIGLLLVAILAAAMSSVSSGMNSLAAVTMEDLRTLGIKAKTEHGEVLYARVLSIVWGVIILVMATFAGEIAPTVIEAINKVGSALYGPILGVFSLAILSRRVSSVSVDIGLLVGLALNLYFWLYQPQIFWMWWNFIGLVVTVSIAVLASFVFKPSARTASNPPALDPADHPSSQAVYILIAAFILMLMISVAFTAIAV